MQVYYTSILSGDTEPNPVPKIFTLETSSSLLLLLKFIIIKVFENVDHHGWSTKEIFGFGTG